MPIPSAPLTPLWVSLLGGGALVGLIGIVQKAVEWFAARREDSFEKVRKDAADVEIARIQRQGEDAKEARDEARRLLTERKEQVAELKADHVAMRLEFGEEITKLKTALGVESEERALVKLSAEAAHIRADEAVQELSRAKRERAELEAKLAAVEVRASKAEQHSATVEREKNVEIDVLRAALDASNRKIEKLENYIREHKMTVSLQQGEQTITASMEPMEPPTHDTDF